MYPTNLDLAAAFDAMGIEYVFRPFEGGHDLTQERLQYSLAFLDQKMNDPAAVEDRATAARSVLRLDPSQPSPVYASTAIRFLAPAGGRATLRIIGTDGRLLETVLDGSVSAGDHTVLWRPRNLPAGVYFCELASGGLRVTQKLVVNR